MVCNYKVRQLFYYKVPQVLLQSATGITKCDNLLQSATGITKCDDYYKVRQYTRAFFFSISVHFFTVLGKSACEMTIFHVLQRTLTHRHKFELFFF